jgi:cytochrome P450
MAWLILLLVLLLLAGLFFRFMTASHDTFQKMNIDTPSFSWFLGNFGQSMRQGIFQSQIEMYKQFKDKKLYGVYTARTPVMMIKDCDMIKDILVKSFNSFVNRRKLFDFDGPFKDNMLNMKGDEWKHVRNVVSPTFSSARVKRMSQHVERHSQRLVEMLRTKQEKNEDVELKNAMSNFTLDVIASTGFGLEVNTIENPENTFAVYAKKCLKPAPLVFVIAFLAPWLLKQLQKVGLTILDRGSLAYFIKTIDSAMESRKEEGRAGKVNDFMDLLMDAEREAGHPEKGTLTRSEMHGQTLLFIIAGYDTVSTVVSFTLFQLANHPEYCRLAQKEIDEKLGKESPNYDNVQGLTYLEMCINEGMRMFPPGFFIERVCNEDATIQGISIPKGMVTSIPVYAVHHDPEIWPEPEKFQPERFSAENKESRHPYAFLPFGHGPRNCIGMRLALIELKITVAAVLKSLTPVACEKTVYPVRLQKYLLKATDDLWVKFEARK